MPCLSVSRLTPTRLVKNKPLNHHVQLPHLYFKLEQTNPSGSHKDRTITYQLQIAFKKKQSVVALSSTGNAAIAANTWAAKNSIKVLTFITPEISTSKLNVLKKIAPYLIVTRRPYRMLAYLQQKYHIPPLNSLLDNSSIVAYQELGFELNKQLDPIDSIFIFISSGSTFLGIAQSFSRLHKKEQSMILPKLYGVTLSKTALPGVYKSILDFDRNDQPFIFEKRKEIIRKIMQQFAGTLLKTTDQEIISTRKTLQQFQQDTSVEGCANFAGVMRYRSQLKNQFTVCLLTGASEQWETKPKISNTLDSIPTCNSLLELDSILKQYKILNTQSQKSHKVLKVNKVCKVKM